MARTELRALALGLLLLLAPRAAGASPPDSTRTHPARVRHRSTLEEAASLPGRAIYLPIGVMGYGARRAVTVIWEDRLLYRLKEVLTFANGRVGIRPLANSLRGTGGRFFVRDIYGAADAEVTSSVGVPSSRRQHHLLTLTWPGALTFSAYYRNEPKRAFHGLGNKARSSDRTTFGQQDAHIQLTSRRALDRRLSLTWHANYHRTRIGEGEGDRYPSTADTYGGRGLPGLEDRVDFAAVGIVLRGLFVDVPGSPRSGNRSRLKLAYLQSIDDDQYSHLQVALLTEQFRELFYRRTVSLQLGTDWRFAAPGSQVPFYELASLGGTDILRGYKQGRYRDDGIAYAVGTYKFPVWKLVEGMAFYESGRSFREPASLSLAAWHYSYGGGLRLWVPEGVVFELLVASSNELTRLQFAFNTTF